MPSPPPDYARRITRAILERFADEYQSATSTVLRERVIGRAVRHVEPQLIRAVVETFQRDAERRMSAPRTSDLW